jgi:D-aminoacyl-tRNA deacylase
VGSSKTQWQDDDAARAVARAILSLRDVPADAPPENGSRRHLVGFGGGHYAPRFERVVRETDWAVGHIAADWSLAALDDWATDDSTHRAVLDRAFRASRADYALLDAQDPERVERLESLGYRVVDETFVRETSGVPLALVEAVESAIEPVTDGLRFGTAATAEPTEWTVVDLPEELWAEARAIDADRLRSWVEQATVAFGTAQNGTVVTGPVALPDGTTRDDIVSTVADILRQRYDTVDREAETLRVREERFDPDLARTAGIPEGPKYGKLSSGEVIEVDGEEIRPERFYRERIRRFTL